MEKSYLRSFFLYIFIFQSVVMGFNWFVDPYDLILTSPKINGFNLLKPEVSSHERLSKSAKVRNLKPKAIILGNSRVAYGFDPDHPGFASQPSYNLGLTGSTIYENMRYFQHAKNIGSLRQVFLAIEPDMLDSKLYMESFSEDRLAVNQKGVPQSMKGFYYDLFVSFFSLDSTISSLITIIRNQAGSSKIKSNGQFFENYHDDQIKVHGQNKFFFHGRPTPKRCINSPSIQVKANSTIYPENFEFYRTILRESYNEEIDLRIVISPFHAWRLEIMCNKYKIENIEKWKRLLVQINNEEAKNANKDIFPLWDFSGYNQFSVEPVPPADDFQTQMRWYFEESHFREKLGNLVLDRTYGLAHSENEKISNFGKILTLENIEAHLENIRKDQEEWQKMNY